ncbi:hypothetical protein M9434_002743 [Picochlorum sp. BPE23]|nr:hypothetical protein M9434_002743 [Picochlorum sp. BPE23]
MRLPLYPDESNATTHKRVFCVTGASGYIGGAIVERLLRAGHTVHGTVRSNPKDTRYDTMRAMDGAKDRLQLFQADLREKGSFDEAVRGCDVVIHVASPVTVRVARGQVEEEVIRPAVEGVEHVVGAIERSGTVDTLVYTGSLSAVHGDNWERGADHVYTEEDWDEVASLSKFPYAYSKVLAEKRVWDLYNESQKDGGSRKPWRLVVLLPGFVVGPPVTQVKSELVEFATLLMKGKLWPCIPNYHFPYVDLDDVAAAHILVAMNSNCHGRYILAHGQHSLGMRDVIQSLRQEFPKHRLPRLGAPKWMLWIASTMTDKVPWDLVASCLNKPMSFQGGRISQDTGLEYHDPMRGMADLMHHVAASILQ